LAERRSKFSLLVDTSRACTFSSRRRLADLYIECNTLRAITLLLTLSRLLHPDHKYSLVKTGKKNVHASENADEAVQVVCSQPSTRAINIDVAKSKPTFPGTLRSARCITAIHPLVSEDETLTPDNKDHDSISNVLSPTPAAQCSEYFGEDNVASVNGDSDDMDLLLSNDSRDDDTEDSQISKKMAQIQHAPLMDVNIISGGTQHLLPQYGLIGSHDEARDTKSKLFLNTNVPFSMFLCGVQGSGKSHTTSCILENSLVPSKLLGKLQNPLSALMFSYGQFSGDGVGFSVSEAAFLASPNPRLLGGAHVKKVHVLVSPSNYVRISKLYLQLPNVSVTPFKLKPRNLDIDTMLTLMNVSESDETPLYMAQVTQILREMSTAGGPFDYKAFKLYLKKQEFNPTQTNMLRMRLNLLESFPDMDDSCPEPQFRPGEITIMDMSCPFVDANTACILFRIGLQRHLQSKGTGKMIVLDEAHKV
jgi:hypothetical protein